MVLINEWLPSPTGNDAAGEWVELWNNGPAAAGLNGWNLITKGGAKTKLSGEIGAGEYRVFWRKDTKLALKNTNEGLALYDNTGRLVDQSSFLGSAQEGKSFSRLRQGYGGHGAQNFVWGDPTPGAANKISLDMSVARNEYPLNQPLNRNLGGAEFLGLTIGTAAVLMALIIFVIKKNEDLSKLFFGRDEVIR